MKLVEIQALAQRLIVKHLPDPLYDDCSEWGFAWNDRIGALGCCHYKVKIIYLSKRWCRNLPDSEILDTILHEIAHALTPNDKSHGAEWKAACIRIGAKPESKLQDIGVYTSDVATPTHRLIDNTGKVVKEYYRKPAAKMYRNIASYYVKSRKEETIGRMQIVEVPLIDTL